MDKVVHTQNSNYTDIKKVLETLKDDYIEMWKKKDPVIHITERDIVSEIYSRLKDYCKEKGLHVHTEVKPKLDDNITTNKKGLPIIDVVILENKDEKNRQRTTFHNKAEQWRDELVEGDFDILDEIIS